ncbi:MAG: hypothetical protein KF757_06850 [Phycisphaeraceae bacterium]|nr:hypothetical protein [Phycisphaeraceae bacterium]
MNAAHTYRQRVNFLGLKAKTLGLTAQEEAELERLQSIRIHETPWAVIVAPIPLDVDGWKAAVQRSRGAPRTLLADNEHKNT